MGVGTNKGKCSRKKCRGIAGGTIPRASTTPSLAAGVIWTKPYAPLEFLSQGEFPVDESHYIGRGFFYL
ncbi:hypothetical protein DM784_00520 [Vibrio furnissii]|nr:hypothetical protein DM784_00520 [Vibrio furnissii]